jgi:hypothetical protein
MHRCRRGRYRRSVWSNALRGRRDRACRGFRGLLGYFRLGRSHRFSRFRRRRALCKHGARKRDHHCDTKRRRDCKVFYQATSIVARGDWVSRYRGRQCRREGLGSWSSCGKKHAHSRSKISRDGTHLARVRQTNFPRCTAPSDAGVDDLRMSGFRVSGKSVFPFANRREDFNGIAQR